MVNGRGGSRPCLPAPTLKSLCDSLSVSKGVEAKQWGREGGREGGEEDVN